MTTELEAARSKVKLYADYDEIKRELEIMKVRFCCFGDRPKNGSDMALS
jgi:homeobox protein cut-like